MIAVPKRELWLPFARIRDGDGKRMRLGTGERLNTPSDPECCCGGGCSICSTGSYPDPVSVDIPDVVASSGSGTLCNVNQDCTVFEGTYSLDWINTLGDGETTCGELYNYTLPTALLHCTNSTGFNVFRYWFSAVRASILYDVGADETTLQIIVYSVGNIDSTTPPTELGTEEVLWEDTIAGKVDCSTDSHSLPGAAIVGETADSCNYGANAELYW